MFKETIPTFKEVLDTYDKVNENFFNVSGSLMANQDYKNGSSIISVTDVYLDNEMGSLDLKNLMGPKYFNPLIEIIEDIELETHSNPQNTEGLVLKEITTYFKNNPKVKLDIMKTLPQSYTEFAEEYFDIINNGGQVSFCVNFEVVGNKYEDGGEFTVDVDFSTI